MLVPKKFSEYIPEPSVTGDERLVLIKPGGPDDWENGTVSISTLLDGKPNTGDLAAVAYSGSYNDLLDKPYLPTTYVSSVNTRTGDVVGLAEQSALVALDLAVNEALLTKANTADLSDVAFSGDYDDLLNKPLIPSVPVTSVNGRIGDVVGLAENADLVSHTTDFANPHAVTKSQVGLSAADNTSDLDKPISTATQTALNAKATVSALTAHTSDVSNPHVVTKSQVGLANADDTSDINKPVSTAQAAAIALKENIITPSTTANYYRGDKTWQPLTTTVVPEGTNLYYTDARADSRIAADTTHVLKAGDTMSGTLTTSGALVATGVYAATPSTPGVYIGIPSTLNPRFTVVPTSGDVRAIDNSTGSLRFINSTAGTVQMVATGSGAFLFGNNETPTHTITLPSVASGIALYNTVDKTTNYERLRTVWSSNVFNIATEAGGTGVSRSILISAFGTGSVSSLRVNNSSTSGFVQSAGSSSTASAIVHAITGTLSSSSGTQYGVAITPTISQTGSAQAVPLLVNPTVSSLGSGGMFLADFQVGGVSKASFDANGAFLMQSAATMSILRFASANNFSSGLGVQKRGAAGDINGAVLDTAEVGYHSFLAWGGTTYRRLAYVIVRAQGNTTETTGGGIYRIFTRDTAGTEAVRVTIDSTETTVAGNIGASAQVYGTSFRPTGSAAPTNGMYLQAANTLGFSTNSTLQMYIGPSGTLFVANNTSVPAVNPTGGGYLYVEAGALKFRGSSGTVTTIANA